jgi:hypothetical protein
MSRNDEEILAASELSLSRAGEMFRRLLLARPALVGDASPPEKNGVYAFSMGDEIIYIGEAAGSSGLRDRIIRKHVSGDEGHALQREFQARFPDRQERRKFIKSGVRVQWIEIPDSLMVSLVEKLAIEVLKPRLNKAVITRTIR